MVNDKAYLVVMVVCLDSSLAIQNILKVFEVLVVSVGLSLFLLDIMAMEQRSCPPLLGIFVCTLTSFVPLGVWGLDLIPTTVWVGIVTNGTLITITID
jgi:hypothetical protein